MGKEKAEKIFHSKQVDAVILTSPANMRYMAGFCGEGYVYLSEKKQFLFFLSDFFYRFIYQFKLINNFL